MCINVYVVGNCYKPHILISKIVNVNAYWPILAHIHNKLTL